MSFKTTVDTFIYCYAHILSLSLLQVKNHITAAQEHTNTLCLLKDYFYYCSQKPFSVFHQL